MKHLLKKSHGAFSLIEIVLAMGIFAFVAVALMGLFSVGLRANSESIDEVEAAHMAESLLATRRAAPLAALDKALDKFPLPPLGVASSSPATSPILITSAGRVAESVEEARFGLIYRVERPNVAQPISRVYVCLYWPPQAGPEKARGHWETSSTFLLQ